MSDCFESGADSAMNSTCSFVLFHFVCRRLLLLTWALLSVLSVSVPSFHRCPFLSLAFDCSHHIPFFFFFSFSYAADVLCCLHKRFSRIEQEQGKRPPERREMRKLRSDHKLTERSLHNPRMVTRIRQSHHCLPYDTKKLLCLQISTEWSGWRAKERSFPMRALRRSL